MKRDTTEEVRVKSTLYFIVFSLVGCIAFFVPFEFRNKSTILIDHIVSIILSDALLIAKIITMAFICWGVIVPFWTGTWKQDNTTRFLSVIQISAIPIGIMYFTGAGPQEIMSPDMIPFLFEKLAMPVGIVIPIGAFFLTFLLAYGLLESIGTLMEPVMRPIFKTPGKSAIDAVASFAGSYSIGLLITSKVYKSGAYSAKEAAIIATGFSTVSATFMLIVAKTLDLTELWGVFFFGSLFVTFLVTIITVRLPPLRHLNNDSTVDETNIEYSEPLLVRSFRNGLKVANHAESLSTLIYANIQGGVVMSTRVVPSILSVGLLGLLIAKYTPVFDIIGLVLWPVVWLFEGEQALEISAIISSGLAEMFLPALQGSNFAIETRYVIGLVSISSILFLSASIPCILGSGIPISLGQMLIVWLQRTLLSIPIAYFMVYVFGIS